MAKVQGRRIELRDPMQNNEKFYRIFTVSNLDYTLCNWGRIGTEGQWMVKVGQNYADRKYNEEVREGYSSVLPGGNAVLLFDVSDEHVKNLQRDFQVSNRKSTHYVALAGTFQQAIGSYASPAAGPRVMSDADKRADVIASLLAKRATFKEPIVFDEADPRPPTPVEVKSASKPASRRGVGLETANRIMELDPDSMESKLAAALRKAGDDWDKA